MVAMAEPAALLPPRFLSRAEAAAYVGVGETTFDEEVAAGLWPAPLRRGAKGARLTWDRAALDAAADRLSGLVRPAAAVERDERTNVAVAAEAAALRRLNGEAQDRPKRRRLRIGDALNGGR